MTKNNEVKKNVTLTFDQRGAWYIYRNEQISKLLANAMDRLNEPIIKAILRYGIARCVDQMHNSADRKISAYESGTQLSLDELFSDAGRSTAKAIAYEQAMDLFLDAAAIDKNAAKDILRAAKKADTSDAWKQAISELKEIIG